MEASPEKPPEIVMIEYRKDWIFDSAQREAPILTDHATKYVQWNLNQPGSLISDDCWGSAGDDDYYYGWNDKHWGSNGVGTEKGRVARGPKADVCGVQSAVDEYPYTVDVSWDGEACAGGDYRVVSDPFHIWDDSVMRDAQTLFELHTGGKKVKGRKSLFALSASATGKANLFYPEIDSDPVDYAIAPEAITLGDLGQLGSDGVLYKALGDGETRDVTPKANGKRYYTFSQPGTTKHRLRIIVNGTCPLQPDRVVTCATNYWVGQRLEFTPMWIPALTGLASKIVQWEFGGNFVNDSWQHSIVVGGDPPTTYYYGSVNYTNNPALLTQENTHAWWVSGDQEYHAHIGEHVTFNNGQQAVVTEMGKFKMNRPIYKSFDPCYLIQVNNFPCLFLNPDESVLALGSLASGGYCRFEVFFTNCPNDAHTAYTQLGSTYRKSGNDDPVTSNGQYWLDNIEFGGGTYNVYQNIGHVKQYDYPGILRKTPSSEVTEDFKTYIRFKPGDESNEDNIWITLGIVTWGWDAKATLSNGVWIINRFAPTSPTWVVDDQFPIWTNILHNY